MYYDEYLHETNRKQSRNVWSCS